MKRTILRGLLSIMCIFALAQNVLADQALIPVGQVIGIELEDGSVTIAAFDEALGVGAQEAGLQVGDRIISIDQKNVSSAADVRRALERADGTVDICLQRKGKEKQLEIKPTVTSDGPRLGVYLKQGVTGVGTVTWYDPDSGSFGALGHGVNTPEGALLDMSGGKAYRAAVMSVKKGACGDPGQLVGTLESSSPIGQIEKNTPQGIFGQSPAGWQGDTISVADSEQIHTGDAVIRSTVRGSAVREYSVEILKIYPNSDATGRNLLLKVTDPALLETTGGIVQGMSGSPIIQDGKLVGAVTHVCVT